MSNPVTLFPPLTKKLNAPTPHHHSHGCAHRSPDNNKSGPKSPALFSDMLSIELLFLFGVTIFEIINPFFNFRMNEIRNNDPLFISWLTTFGIMDPLFIFGLTNFLKSMIFVTTNLPKKINQIFGWMNHLVYESSVFGLANIRNNACIVTPGLLKLNKF